MDLRLYDTLTKQKRTFTPIDASNVRMYVCGPTVYDFAHIGNARPAIVFDVLFRLLRHKYGADHVTYVRNITDVDDKINDRALRDFPDLPLNDAIRKVTEKTEAQFHADVDALGCLRPTHEPRATDFVLPRSDGKTPFKSDMVTLIVQLIDRGHAYVAGGEVLFDTQSMPDYGALSGRRLEDQKAGARVAVDAHKKNPADFVLWKGSSENEPGWDSPWGRGRPGWHIECSAMSAAYLGTMFDIHGGGLDLIFPHHENEIAQSRCAHGTPVMANVWMHNGFLQVEGEKMSKSTGNFVTIRELLDDWPGDVLRFQMLMTHYRSPIDWTERTRNLAVAELEEWAESLHSHFDLPSDLGPDDVAEALSDDLNTSAAIAVLRELHVAAKKGGLKDKLKFATNCKLLGFKKLSKPGLFRFGVSGLNVRDVAIGQYEPSIRKLRAATANAAPAEVRSEILSVLFADGLNVDESNSGDFTIVRGSTQENSLKVQKLVDVRLVARQSKDFTESDRIRDELLAMGVTLKDSKDADGKPITTWEIAR